METWKQMKNRHYQERFELVQSLALANHTQTEAAKILDTTMRNLNNYIHRYGIYWPVIKQGRTKNAERSEAIVISSEQSSINNQTR